MKRFSKLFWFTVFVGTLASALVSHALVGHLTARLHEMVAFCTPRNDACGAAAINGAFQAFCLTAVAGNALVFWLAYKIGCGFIKPVAADAAR
jgi:uncharacterized membrane protein